MYVKYKENSKSMNWNIKLIWIVLPLYLGSQFPISEKQNTKCYLPRFGMS